eukprot:jgi/Astpho2/5381/fgenesh1_pg.00075_%23_51_t
MARLAVAHVAALVCCIGGIQAVGNGPYLGGLTFRSTQTVSANLRFTGRGPAGSNASAQTELMVESGGGSLNVTKQIYLDHPNITLTHIHIAYANSTATPGGQLQLINAPVVSIYQNSSGNDFLNGNDSPIGQNGLLSQVLANGFSIPLAGLPLECLLDCCTVITTDNGCQHSQQ